MLFAMLVVGLVGFAGACRAADDPFGGAAPLSDQELQSARGGYFSADGQTFGFSATLVTLIDGQTALTTTLTLQNNGSVTQQTDANLSVLANDSSADKGVVVAIPVNGAASLASALAGTNVNVNGLSASGLVVKGDGGVTALLDNITPNSVQNLVINTANGRNITQDTFITITLPSSEIAAAQQGAMMNGLLNALQAGQIGAR